VVVGAGGLSASTLGPQLTPKPMSTKTAATVKGALRLILLVRERDTFVVMPAL
jgi:hypothetical protein